MAGQVFRGMYLSLAPKKWRGFHAGSCELEPLKQYNWGFRILTLLLMPGPAHLLNPIGPRFFLQEPCSGAVFHLQRWGRNKTKFHSISSKVQNNPLLNSTAMEEGGVTDLNRVTAKWNSAPSLKMGTTGSGPQSCGRSRRGSIACGVAVLPLLAGALDVVT